jgi:hypothetical protein
LVQVFPVDCVSHGAVATIKKLCRQSGKSDTPLRTTSLASLLSVLMQVDRSQKNHSSVRPACRGVAGA